MNNKRFYQETFSQIHGSADVRWEDYQMMKRRKSLKRLFMLAAVIALAAALSGLAVAANFFGLRDTLLPEKGSVYVTDENGIVVPGEYEYKDFVSLSGYMNSPESQALAEWQAFLENYDQDGAIISEIGNSPTGFEEKYGNYLVYTQEMADKLDAIVEKYGLHLHTRMEIVLPSVWTLAVGENFLRENNMAWSGYIYEDGTFRYDGEAVISGYGTLEYQFSRSVDGSFDDVMLNIRNLSDFEEWGYRTMDGTMVTLGLGGHTRSLIMADMGDCFILINVLAGMERDDVFSSGSIGRAELETLADSFDYAVLAPVQAPDFSAILEENERCMEALENQPLEVTPEESEDSLYIRTGIQSDVAKEFILLLAERLEDDRREEIADLLVYPAQVTTADGIFEVNSPEEFLEYYDETVGQSRFGLAADMTWDLSPQNIFSDGSGLAAAANGAVWFGLIEDGMIRVFTIQTDQWSIRPVENGIGEG